MVAPGSPSRQKFWWLRHCWHHNSSHRWRRRPSTMDGAREMPIRGRCSWSWSSSKPLGGTKIFLSFFSHGHKLCLVQDLAVWRAQPLDHSSCLFLGYLIKQNSYYFVLGCAVKILLDAYMFSGGTTFVDRLERWRSWGLGSQVINISVVRGRWKVLAIQS